MAKLNWENANKTYFLADHVTDFFGTIDVPRTFLAKIPVQLYLNYLFRCSIAEKTPKLPKLPYLRRAVLKAGGPEEFARKYAEQISQHELNNLRLGRQPILRKWKRPPRKSK